MASDWTHLHRRLDKQGFTIERLTGRSGHYRVRRAPGPFVVIPASAGKGRALKNALSQLRKIGYQP